MDVFTYSTIVKVTRHIYTLISMSSSSHDFIAFAKFIDVFFLFLVEWRLVILDSFTIFFLDNFMAFASISRSLQM